MAAPPMARNNASASETAMWTRRFNDRHPRRRPRNSRTPDPSSWDQGGGGACPVGNHRAPPSGPAPPPGRCVRSCRIRTGTRTSSPRSATSRSRVGVRAWRAQIYQAAGCRAPLTSLSFVKPRRSGSAAEVHRGFLSQRPQAPVQGARPSHSGRAPRLRARRRASRSPSVAVRGRLAPRAPMVRRLCGVGGQRLLTVRGDRARLHDTGIRH